jgi:tetratricopeptide (TPR) repeat protein
MASWAPRLKASLAVVLSAAFVWAAVAPAASAADDKKGQALSSEVFKFAKPAQEANNKGDFETGFTQAKLALEAARAAKVPKAFDLQTSLGLLAQAAQGKKDYLALADALEQLNGIEGATAEQKGRNYRSLAQIYGQSAMYDKAVPNAKLWIEQGNGGAEGWAFLAKLYLIQKDCANGIVALEKSVEGKEPTETDLKLEYQCYSQLGQKAKVTQALEALESRFFTREYFIGLMGNYEADTDAHAMMNLWRLAFDRDFMTRESEFLSYSDMALEAGSPAEALKVLETGIQKGAVKIISQTDSNARRLKQAKDLTADDKKMVGSLEKEARAGKSGEADVKVGLAYFGLGEYDKAVESIERGLTPDRVGKVKRLDDAYMNLAVAYYKLGKKDLAEKAFKSAEADPRMARAARVWLQALPNL